MFSTLPNQQQLVPMGIQQQQVVGLPVQGSINSIQAYTPPIPRDTFINVGKQESGRGFWDGFTFVFSKIGEFATKIGQFCAKNFELVLTAGMLFGGYKICNSSMKTYEKNQNDGKLDENGNLNDKDKATIKDKVQNFIGYYVHKVFGSSDAENVEEENEKELTSEEKTKIDNAEEDALKKILKEDYIDKGKISSVLDAYKEEETILINILEVIRDNIESISGKSKYKRPNHIITALDTLRYSSNTDIKSRAKEVIKEIKKTTYFTKKQQQQLEQL